MTRQGRLRALLDEYWMPDVDVDELLHEPTRYALIEGYPISRHHYISTHRTLEDAGEYHANQEDQGWGVEVLVDLDTGQLYDAAFSITWTLHDARMTVGWTPHR